MRGPHAHDDLPADVRDDVYWVALLRYVGCTGHAPEVATVFGDEIAIRAATLVHDAATGDHSGLALLCVDHMEAAE